MKNNITFLLIFAAISISILTGNFACKPQKEKTFMVGIINPNPEAREGAKGFMLSLKELGYVEGENITYLRHESKEGTDDAIKDMVKKNVDLIFTYTTPATKKAKQFTANTGIPVVFIVFDPVGSGLVESMTQPRGNLTGIQIRGNTAKSLEWLHAVAPDIKNIFIPISFDTMAANQSLEALKTSAAKLNIKLTLSEINTIEEYHTLLSTKPEGIDAVFVLHSILIDSNVKALIDTAIKWKIPIASSGHEHHKIGALVCYGPHADSAGSQAARLGHSILQGAPPSELPVETSDFFLGINMETARKIGIEIPNDVLQQADVIVRN